MSRTIPSRAVIYCRISRDPEGRELGVRRQEDDCRALAKRLGMTVVRVYVENDVSASSHSKKPRPQYAAMLAAVDAGEADVILAYSNSRLTRRPKEWLELIERAKDGRMEVRTVVSGSHDLSTADGRAVAFTIAAWDAAEAERTAERARRAKSQALADGRWLGGHRPFGYEADGMTLRPAEADLVRHATRDLLTGRSLGAISREWNEAGFVGSTGRPFTPTRVRRILQRGRNAGLIERDINGPTGRGEIIGKAAWPAIVTEDEWRALQAHFANPARKTTPGPERRWLGSGIYRCECGSTMYVTGSKGRTTYRCKVSPHVTRSQPQVDEYVSAVVREYLREPRIIDRLRPAKDDSAAKADRDRADELRRKMAVWEADYFAENINGRQLREFTDRAEAELADIAIREAARLADSTLADVLTAADPAAAFDSATLDRQRAIVDALVSVTIHQGRKGRPPGWVPGQPYADMGTVKIRGRGQQ